jgi:hypothetical protein
MSENVSMEFLCYLCRVTTQYNLNVLQNFIISLNSFCKSYMSSIFNTIFLDCNQMLFCKLPFILFIHMVCYDFIKLKYLVNTYLLYVLFRNFITIRYLEYSERQHIFLYVFTTLLKNKINHLDLCRTRTDLKHL